MPVSIAHPQYLLRAPSVSPPYVRRGSAVAVHMQIFKVKLALELHLFFEGHHARHIVFTTKTLSPLSRTKLLVFLK